MKGMMSVSDKKTELDATDWKILTALQDDTRKTFKEMGEAVGLTAPAVRERILRMEEAGIIEGYRVSVDAAALGRVMHVMVSVKLDMESSSAEANACFVKLLDASAGVIRYWTIYGELDFLVEAAFPSKDSMDEFLNTLRRYGFVKTHLIVRSVKEEYKAPR